MTDLYDQTGALVSIPDEDATAAITSGKFALPAGTLVPVKTDDGIKQMPFALAQQQLSKGDTFATKSDIRAEDLDKRYGGVLGGLEATGEGALSGATLGLSDVAAAGIGGDSVRQHLADVKEAHPYLHGAGELAGTLAPALLSGGLSEGVSAGEIGGRVVADAAEHAGGFGSLLKGAGRVLAAPTEAAGAVGGAFERGVGKLVGSEATGLGGRILQGGARIGARGAAEGALYGGGQELSEQSLGDAPLNGEKLLAAVGHGALLGGLGGAGLGAAGEVGSEALGRVATRLSGTAEERAAKSIISGSGQLKSIKEMDRVPGGLKAVGRELIDRDLIRAGDTVDDIAPRVAAERSKVGSQLGTLLEQADTAGAQGPSVANVYRTLEDHIATLEPLATLNGGAIGKVRALMADIAKAGGVDGLSTTEGIAPELVDHALGDAHLGFKQAQQLRVRIQDAINYNRTPGVVSPVEDALKSARQALEGEIEKAGDAAGKKLGSDWLKEYKDTKLTYRKLAVADDAAGRAVASRSANRIISPSDYGAGGLAGAALGIVHGSSPLGLAGAIATSIAHKYVRERGAATAAVYLDKVAQLGAVKRAAALVDRRIETGVAHLASAPGAKALPLHEASGSYQEVRARVVKAAQDMGAHRDAVDKAIGPLSGQAPDTAAAFKGAAVRSTSYLVSQVPQHPPPSSILQQNQKPYVPSRIDQAAFMRKVDAVNDPVSLLAHAKAGTITKDQVDAVAKTHPELLKEMREKTLDRLSSMPANKSLSLQEKLALSTLLGQPVDGTVAPRFMASMQSAYAGTPKPPPSPTGDKPSHGAPKRKVDVAKSTGFTTDTN